MTPENFCDICHCPLIHPKESDVKVKREFLPGSEGCFSLNEKLWAYFVATKLLKLQEEHVLKLMTATDPDDGTILYSKMCARCEIIVSEALELHTQVVMLQRKIDQLAATLSKLLKSNDGSDSHSRLDKTKKHSNLKSSKGKSKFQTVSSSYPSSDWAQGSRDETTRQMLDLSMACLGKTKFPTKKSASPLLHGRRLLRNRRVRKQISSNKQKDSNFKISEGNDTVAIGDEGTGGNYENIHVHTEKNDDLDLKTEAHELEQELLIQQELEQISIEEKEEKSGLHRQNETVSNEGSDMDYEPDDTGSESDDSNDSDLDFNPQQVKKQRLDNFADDDGEEEEEETVNHVIGSDEQPSTSIDKDQILSRVMVDASKTAMIDFQCTSCGKIFSNKSSLLVHELKAHGLKRNYTCPKCPELTFSRRLLMIEHRNKVHGNVCDECGKELSSRKSLRVHLQRAHKMLLSFPCPLCKMVFNRMKPLREHHRKVHVVSKSTLVKLPLRPPQTPEEEEWLKMPCEICGKKYLSGGSLDQHLYQIHEVKVAKKKRKSMQVTCCFCWKSFYLKQRLAIHMKMAHADMANNSASFPCELCQDNNGQNTAAFRDGVSLLEHLNGAHTHAPVHKCVKCGWPFLNEESLKQHEKVHQWAKLLTDEQKAMQESFQFKCCFCWRAFPDGEKLKRHLDVPRHHSGSKLEFYCDVDDCEHHLKNAFTHVDDLNQHLAVAHADASLLHKCNVCSWGFVSADILELHKLNHVHAIKGRRACPRCDVFSTSLQGLKSHYNLCHGKHLKLFKCAHCDKKFRVKAFLEKHVMENHPNVKEGINNTFTKIPCDQCGKLYGNETKLKLHHLNQHQHHQCKDCGKEFDAYIKYRRHVQAVHGQGQKHLCSVCGKEFLNRGEFSVHMNTHREKKYQCHACHVRMADLDKMKEHIKRIHENPNKNKVEANSDFVCGECGKRFSRKDTLDDHVRVKHTDGTWRVWECEKCGKRYKRSNFLIQHQKGKTCPGSREIIIV